MNVMKIITTITKNEAYNENLINYYIVAIDKHFNRNYFKIDKEKIINYTINDYITIAIYKIINLDFNNSNLIITKSF